jgi:hypothetical protein
MVSSPLPVLQYCNDFTPLLRCKIGDPSVVMKVVKQRFARQLKHNAGELLAREDNSGRSRPMPSGLLCAFTALNPDLFDQMKFLPKV